MSIPAVTPPPVTPPQGPMLAAPPPPLRRRRGLDLNQPAPLKRRQVVALQSSMDGSFGLELNRTVPPSFLQPRDAGAPNSTVASLFNFMLPSASLFSARNSPPLNNKGLTVLTNREPPNRTDSAATSQIIFTSDSPRATRYEDSNNELGSGSFGSVRVVRNTQTSSPSAFKLYNTSNNGNINKLEWAREIDFYGRARGSRHLVVPKKAFSAREGMIPILAMPLLDNTPIKNLSYEQTLIYIKSSLEFLNDLHEKGIIHTDFKPINSSFNRKTSQCFFFDLGACQNNDMIFKNKLIQTPPYRAPELLHQEIAKSEFSFGPSIDIWSLGCSAFEAYTGRRLIDPLNTNPEDLLGEIETQFPDEWANRLTTKAGKKKDIPGEKLDNFISLIRSMLQIDPKDRITAQEGLRALSELESVSSSSSSSNVATPLPQPRDL